MANNIVVRCPHSFPLNCVQRDGQLRSACQFYLTKMSCLIKSAAETGQCAPLVWSITRSLCVTGEVQEKQITFDAFIRYYCAGDGETALRSHVRYGMCKLEPRRWRVFRHVGFACNNNSQIMKPKVCQWSGWFKCLILSLDRLPTGLDFNFTIALWPDKRLSRLKLMVLWSLVWLLPFDGHSQWLSECTLQLKLCDVLESVSSRSILGLQTFNSEGSSTGPRNQKSVFTRQS